MSLPSKKELIEAYQKTGAANAARALSHKKELIEVVCKVAGDDIEKLQWFASYVTELVDAAMVWGKVLSLLSSERFMPGTLERFEEMAKQMLLRGEHVDPYELLGVTVEDATPVIAKDLN